MVKLSGTGSMTSPLTHHGQTVVEGRGIERVDFIMDHDDHCNSKLEAMVHHTIILCL